MTRRSETVTSARAITSDTNWVNSEYLLVREIVRPREVEVVGAPRAKLITSAVD